MTSRYKLTISYDGTHYLGWQVQKQALSIQALIQKALETVLRHPIQLSGSGRTDSGVHARGQTAHFDSPLTFDPHKLKLSVNALLPLDIRILSIEQASPTFHARYDATSKIYHYHLHLDPTTDPFNRLYSTHVLKRLNLDLLKKGALLFTGTHDFTSFANEKEKKNPDAVRTLMRLDVIEQKGGVRLEFEGDGFLYKMVRNITGTLIDVAAGKIPLEEIPKMFAARDRKKGGSAAPPQGLFLMQVIYGGGSPLPPP
jgi:tRNA pseudouridine38-40 synthase